MYRHILVPVDDSIFSAHTVSRAVEFARTVGARITFFHAVADYASSGEGALTHVIEPAVFRAHMVGRAKAVLHKALLAADIGKIPSEASHAVSNRPYEAILQEVRARGCDLVFMASHGQQGLSRLMVGSQTLKVLSQASVPVLVDTSESRVSRPAMTRTLGIILDGHRTCGVLLRQLQALLREISAGRVVPDFSLMQILVTCLDEFSRRRHQPKEEAYLFALLRQRSPEAEVLLSELELQYQEEPRRLARLAAALDAWEADPMNGFKAFICESDDYIDFVWKYIVFEEREVFPLAMAKLTEIDWAKIAKAFGENGNQKFGIAQDKLFREGVWRLLSDMPITE